ncbi:hypothetical protein EDD85DRAFT_976009 [Armillaria nabsnona]|nr:hypothetical protein EDD85DRAFT_976009 [Armillaria nabsnona]
MYTLLDRYWMRKKRVIPPDAATNASMWWTQSKIAARNSVRQVLVDVEELDDTVASVEQIERAENDTKAKDAENTVRLRVAMAVEKHSRDEDEVYSEEKCLNPVEAAYILVTEKWIEDPMRIWTSRHDILTCVATAQILKDPSLVEFKRQEENLLRILYMKEMVKACQRAAYLFPHSKDDLDKPDQDLCGAVINSATEFGFPSFRLLDNMQVKSLEFESITSRYDESVICWQETSGRTASAISGSVRSGVHFLFVIDEYALETGNDVALKITGAGSADAGKYSQLESNFSRSPFCAHNCLILEVLGMSLEELTRRTLSTKCPIPMCRGIIKEARLGFSSSQFSIGLKLDNLLLCVEDTKGVPLLGDSESSIDLSRVCLGPSVVDISDFGVASHIENPFDGVIQPYALRAPEVYLRIPYGPSTDIWNLSCLMASLNGLTSFPVDVLARRKFGSKYFDKSGEQCENLSDWNFMMRRSPATMLRTRYPLQPEDEPSLAYFLAYFDFALKIESPLGNCSAISGYAVLNVLMRPEPPLHVGEDAIVMPMKAGPSGFISSPVSLALSNSKYTIQKEGKGPPKVIGRSAYFGLICIGLGWRSARRGYRLTALP